MKTPGRALWVSLVFVLAVGGIAQANFVNGRESFPGTTLDTATWQAFSFVSSISQNNGLTINTYQNGGYYADYTTKNLTVGPGKIVRALVNIQQNEDTSSGLMVLFLTSNSMGTQNSSWYDDAYIGIMSGYDNLSTLQGGDTQGAGFIIAPHRPPLGTPYVWEINRTSKTSAIFTVRDIYGSPIGSFTDNNLGLYVPGGVVPDQLHIAMYTQGCKATISSVEIVPEPAVLPLLLFSMLLGGRRARQAIES